MVKNKFECPYRVRFSGWCLLIKDYCKVYGLVEGFQVLVCKAEKILKEKKQSSLF